MIKYATIVPTIAPHIPYCGIKIRFKAIFITAANKVVSMLCIGFFKAPYNEPQYDEIAEKTALTNNNGAYCQASLNSLTTYTDINGFIIKTRKKQAPKTKNYRKSKTSE